MPLKNKKFIGRITCVISDTGIFKGKKYKDSISTFLYIVTAKTKRNAENQIKAQFESTFSQKIKDKTIKIILFNVILLENQSGTVYFSFDAFLTDIQSKQVKKINWLS